jgi:hypothetical protein
MRLLIAALGLAVIAGSLMLGFLILVPEQYRDRIDWKWARFGVVTVVFAGYCLRTYWRARNHLRFWGILSCVFIVHFFGVGYFFYRGPGLPLLAFGPIVALEWAALALAVYHFLGIGPPVQKY